MAFAPSAPPKLLSTIPSVLCLNPNLPTNSAEEPVFLWSVFSDVYEILGGPDKLATIIQADPDLASDIHRIIEGSSPGDPDGSFWHFPPGRVPLSHALGAELRNVLRTIRNSFAHSHWCYCNMSALDYWVKQGWGTATPDPAFHLEGRPAKNYMLYLADGNPWRPQSFWSGLTTRS